MQALNILQDELRFVLITSKASVAAASERPADARSTEVDGLWISIAKSAGEKCVRCWHHREDVGADTAHPELCLRCVDNVDGDGEVRHYA